MSSSELTEDQQRWAKQAHHFETNVHFNRTSKLRVDRWDDQMVIMTLPHEEWKCNSTESFHGGVIASLADTCGSAASLAAIGGTGYIATVSMQINYLNAATTTITATGVCIKRGKRLQVAEVKVVDANGKLVADATITTMQP